MKNTTDKKEEEMKDQSGDKAGHGNSSSPEQDKLDAVRDLLFGQNVKEYRDEIKEVKDLLEKNKSLSDASVDATKVEILQRLDQLSKQFEERSNQLEKQIETLTSAKVDKISLAGLLKDIANRLES